MRALPPIAMFFAAASVGPPGLGNFVGEFLILPGAFKVNTLVTMFAASGLVLGAVYALMMVQRSIHGAPKAIPRARLKLSRTEHDAVPDGTVTFA